MHHFQISKRNYYEKEVLPSGMQYRIVSIEHVASIFDVKRKDRQNTSGKQAASRTSFVDPLNHKAL
jgi:hypothetical protein